MNSIVVRWSRWMSINSSVTAACTDTSSADTGSSAMIIFGLPAKARAMPIRCFWPPESWRGFRRANSFGSLTVDSSCSTRSVTLSRSRSTPNLRITRAIWPPTLWLGFRVSNGFWKIICKLAMVLASRCCTGRWAKIELAEQHLAGGRFLEAHQHLGEGRLAATRFADDGDRLRLAGRRKRCPRWP